MMTDTIGHGLDQDWPRLPHADLPGLLGGVVDGEHVVAVDPDGGHAVRRTPNGDPVTPILFGGGG